MHYSGGGGGGGGGAGQEEGGRGSKSSSYEAVIIHKIREVIPGVVFVPRLDVHLVLTLLAEIQGPDLFAEIGLGRHPMVHSARRPPPSAITSGSQHSARKTPENRRSCSRGWHTLTGIQSLAILTRGSAPYITYRAGLPCLPQ